MYTFFNRAFQTESGENTTSRGDQMTVHMDQKQERELLKRGYTRRSFGRIAALMSARWRSCQRFAAAYRRTR